MAKRKDPQQPDTPAQQAEAPDAPQTPQPVPSDPITGQHPTAMPGQTPLPPEERQEGDLERMAKLGHWLLVYRVQILTVLLVVLVLVTAWNAVSTWTQTSRRDDWQGLNNAQSPADVQVLLAQDPRPTVRALALLQAADQLLYQASFPQPQPQPQPEESQEQDTPGAAEAEQDTAEASGAEEPTPEAATPDEAASEEATLEEQPGQQPSVEPEPIDRQEALAQAEQLYRQVYADKSLQELYRLNALVGLASVYEGQAEQDPGLWGAAREHWERARRMAGETYPLIRQQAIARLQRLDRLREPVRFAAAKTHSRPRQGPPRPPAPEPGEVPRLDLTPEDQAGPDEQPEGPGFGQGGIDLELDPIPGQEQGEQEQPEADEGPGFGDFDFGDEADEDGDQE